VGDVKPAAVKRNIASQAMASTVLLLTTALVLGPGCDGTRAGAHPGLDAAPEMDTAAAADLSVVETAPDTSEGRDLAGGDTASTDVAAADAANPPGPPYVTTIRLMNVGSKPVIVQQGMSGPGACSYGFQIAGGGLPNIRRIAHLERPDSICACERCHAGAARPLVCDSNDPICEQPLSLAPGATLDFPWDGMIVFNGPPPLGSDCPITACDLVAPVPAGLYQFSLTFPAQAGADPVTYRSESALPAPDGRVVIAVGGN